jgi:hypothetical protein
MAKHENKLNCLKCTELLIKYNGCHQTIYDFVHTLRSSDNSAHISCGPRGRIDQEIYFQRGATRAHYGQSAHNYGAAIDIFRIDEAGKLSYDKTWFKSTVGRLVAEHNQSQADKLTWYGAPKSKFFELPHVELTNWKKMNLKLSDGPI